MTVTRTTTTDQNYPSSVSKQNAVLQFADEQQQHEVLLEVAESSNSSSDDYMQLDYEMEAKGDLR
jgi:hypothetical protein